MTNIRTKLPSVQICRFSDVRRSIVQLFVIRLLLFNHLKPDALFIAKPAL